MSERENRRYLWVVVAGVCLFAAATCAVNWVKLVSLRSTWPYDMAFFDHLAYTHARGANTIYMFYAPWFNENDHVGPSVFRICQFRLILLFIAQFYRLWSSPLVLMAFQSAFVTVGAIPLYWLGARMTERPRLGLLLAFSYLLHPAVCQMAFNDFRTLQLGMGPALFALWFHQERKAVPFLVACLLALSCRQEYVFFVAVLGAINWRSFSSQRDFLLWGLGPVGIALAWAVVVNAFYWFAFGHLWPVLAARVEGAPTEAVLSKVCDRLPIFMRTTLLPGFLALLRPEAFLLALPSVVYSNKLFWPAFPQHNLHQLSISMVIVFWAFATGVCGLWPKVEGKRALALASGILLATSAGLSFLHFGWGTARAYFAGGMPWYEKIAQIDRDLPEDATVMAAKGVIARLSHHHRVLTYQGLPYGSRFRPPDAELRRMVEELVSVCDLVVTQAGDEWIDELAARSGRYEPAQVIEADRTQFVKEVEPGVEMPVRTPIRYHFHVARRDAPRPETSDLRLQQILRWDQMDKQRRRWATILVD
jgi:hypothetical protein